METKITLVGKIRFEPENRTKKHNAQSSWKRVAMVLLSGDVCEYYAWFIQKRYNLVLNKPLRGAHISFINDSIKELSCNGTKTIEQIDADWEAVKKKWDGKEIPVILDLNAATDDKHWWLRVSPQYRDRLHGIRAELGLGQPFFGLHMTIGYANEKNIEHSKYIHNLVKKGFIK
jgi:hypothetical protein